MGGFEAETAMVRQAATQTQPTSKANGVWPKRRLFSVDEYHRMGKAGILYEDDRVELWDGEIIQMPPIGGGHASSTDGFGNQLAHDLYGRAIVRVQNPLRLSPRFEPEPDIAVVHPRPDRYRTNHPGPEDVLLLIEISDSTLRYDRDRKLPGYARAGIQEGWIADLRRKRLLVYRNPRDGEYTEQFILGPADSVSPMEFPDVSIPIAAVLG